MTNTTGYSRIIAGTMNWGDWGKQLSKSDMERLMHFCLECNITTFDHADIYGDYSNEEQFGAVFKNSAIHRENIQLISKCGIQLKGGSRANRVGHYDYGKDYIIWCTERSLKVLGTDYLDMLLLHRPSPLMHPNDIAEAVTRLKTEGKIRQFGVSNFSPSQIALIETLVPVEGNQVEFSLTSNEAMNDGTLDDCIINKRFTMSWSPLGAYFKEDSNQTKRLKPVLNELCEKYTATEDQLLLSWVLKHPATIYPVVGTTNADRLALAIKAAKIELELEDWFILLEASNGHQVA